MTSQSQPGRLAHPRAAAQDALLMTDDVNALREKGRRVIFKNVFESPFNFKWPTLSAEDNQEILDTICRLLSPVGECRRVQAERRKSEIMVKIIQKRKARAAKLAAAEQTQTTSTPQTLDELEAVIKKQKKKKNKSNEPISADINAVHCINTSANATIEGSGSKALQSEEMEMLASLKDIVLGINMVTKNLEMMCSRENTRVAPRLRLVLLCSGDVAVSQLYSHIPTLTYLAGGGILLCALGRGAEPVLAKALGIKRVSIIGIKSESPRFDVLYDLFSSKLPPLNIPWLPRTADQPKSDTSASNAPTRYQSTKISAVKTSMPIVNRTKGKPDTSTGS